MSTTETITARLEPFVRAHAPERADLAITAMHKLPVGFSYETYLFTLAWRDGDTRRTEDLVMRMEPEHGLIPPYDVRPQYELLKRLHGHALPVPEAYWLEASGSVLGRPFFIMERLPGETMYGYAMKHPERVPDLRRQLADVIVDLHQIDWQAMDLGVLGVPAHDRDHAEREIARWERELKDSMLAPYPLTAELFRYLKNNVPRAQRTAFCHGDIQPANLLVHEGKLSAVLDWELATLGDPLVDLGWSCATIEKYFGAAWNADDFILRHYEARTGTRVDREALRFWKVFAFVKGITMVCTGLRAGIELAEPKATLLGLYPVNMATFPDAAAKLIGF